MILRLKTEKDYVAVVLAFSISAFISTFAIIIAIPPSHNFFIYQKLYEAVGTVFLGLSTLIYWPIALRLPVSLSIPIIIIIGLLFGLLLQALWRKKDAWIKLSAILFIVNSLFGSFIAIFVPIAIESNPYDSCIHIITEDKLIKTVAYKEFGGGLYTDMHYFYLSSIDQGKTWKQIIHYEAENWHTKFMCDYVGSYSENQYWAWYFDKFAITHNGGISWNSWDSSYTCPENSDCLHGIIIDVSFTDDLNGKMHIAHDQRAKVPTSILLTNDGGVSWTIH